ncbi:receptor-interacting serine/threonine-protein kinase 3 isoform X2 [Platichthys flesus]|nr:receptor-interacting serine/threonine-protein kinase 3 isoform X2 [Platichthys flesus]
MDLEGVPPPVIEDSILTDWVSIGAGGFGEIYKAKHKRWNYDVAIKLLHNDGGQTNEKRIQALQREVQMMLRGSSEYVMPVLGIFNGRPQNSGPSAQLGLVMKYMEKGSLESLQKSLDAVPPLPLVFRLAHQVALGINFLHSLSPPILHRDLKPNNVLLDSYLNVKLTDFGLSQPSQTQAQVSKKDKEDGAGTLSYMPPEAFDINYKPSRAFDIYSYGILLWSIATGEQPYPYAAPSLMQLLIPKGQRPSLEELSNQAELRGLVELMEKCWGGNPTERPPSFECTKITEKLYERHEHEINDVVHEVLKKLREQKERDKLAEKLQSLCVTPAKGSPRVEAVKNQDHVKTGPPPVQEVVPERISNQRVKDLPASQQANMCDVDTTRSSTDDHELKASSVRPIGESPAPPSTTRSPQASGAKNSLRDLKNPPQPFQRQLSSPTPSTSQPTHNVYIHCSHVTGVQIGNKNTLYINKEPSERKRHPTAPSRVNPPSPHPGSRKN